VYLDGAVENVVVSNIVERNGKEGICLDNGSTSNVVIRNVVQQNGNRWGQPDYVLAQDFVAGLGRLQDGTAAAKVPGISVDNALYNVIYSNTVSHNFGGGIKVVRTGYYNLIGANTIVGNNDGASSRFHFFGIDLGAAALDAASDELDGGPSRGNIVFSNLIRGNHFSGIYFDNDSDQNDIFDNVIMDAQRWALESVKSMPNSSLNNLTNLASRNISSGLSPALIGGRINP
jgi:parallel beta-helix repeat protein